MAEKMDNTFVSKSRCGLVHSVTRFDTGTIVESGQYETYGFRVYVDDHLIITIFGVPKNIAIDQGIVICNKVAECKQLAKKYTANLRPTLIMAESNTKDPYRFFGVQFHTEKKNENDFFVRQDTKLGDLMYPYFSRWTKIFQA